VAHKAQEYRDNADRALRMSANPWMRPQDKAAWLKLAHDWLQLARDVETERDRAAASLAPASVANKTG
jgi:hypothetical protein